MMRSVSYTHLDVYKRQMYRSVRIQEWHVCSWKSDRMCTLLAEILLMPSMKAVSYTHLDVYKRQTFDDVEPGVVAERG